MGNFSRTHNNHSKSVQFSVIVPLDIRKKYVNFEIILGGGIIFFLESTKIIQISKKISVMLPSKIPCKLQKAQRSRPFGFLLIQKPEEKG